MSLTYNGKGYSKLETAYRENIIGKFEGINANGIGIIYFNDEGFLSIKNAVSGQGFVERPLSLEEKSKIGEWFFPKADSFPTEEELDKLRPSKA